MQNKFRTRCEVIQIVPAPPGFKATFTGGLEESIIYWGIWHEWDEVLNDQSEVVKKSNVRTDNGPLIFAEDVAAFEPAIASPDFIELKKTND